MHERGTRVIMTCEHVPGVKSVATYGVYGTITAPIGGEKPAYEIRLDDGDHWSFGADDFVLAEIGVPVMEVEMDLDEIHKAQGLMK